MLAQRVVRDDLQRPPMAGYLCGWVTSLQFVFMSDWRWNSAIPYHNLVAFVVLPEFHGLRPCLYPKKEEGLTTTDAT